ncbi:helix-turn-helix domain-containing protein [Salinisphaera hydrothermalis]|uniref:helix-turn-helix domain-containing protein n=1 Tax=Salinisphaera hydrothermalis TaxID=563188 RepID=UPI003341C6C0
MNATHDDQSDQPKEPGLAHDADDETTSTGLTRNKSDAQTPGEMLREGRLAHDYSVDDLCAQTKLSTHTIEALEDNDFQSLSQPVFARGYYRQCAKVLDLDVERIMAAYTAMAGEPPKPKIDHGSVGAGIIPQDVTPGGGFRFRGLLILLLIIVVVIAVVVFVLPSSGVPGAITGNNDNNADQGSQSTTTFEFNSSNDDTSGGSNNSSDTAASDTGNADATASNGSNASMPSTPDVVGDNGGQPRTGQQAGGRNVNQTLGINPPNGSGAQGDQTANGGSAATQSSQPSVPPNRLVLTFSKRSWVRVTDANGNRMASGIFKPGDSKEFNGKPPYKITLGYAPGVKVTIGGQSVDVASQTSGGGIAHLTVDAPKSDSGNNG